MVIYLPAPLTVGVNEWTTQELPLLILLYRLIRSMMPLLPPMGGQELQGILGGVADGLELSKRPLCE